MGINFSSGNKIQEIVLRDGVGFAEVELPIDVEVLNCGLNLDKAVVVYVGIKYTDMPKRLRKFLVHSSGAPLPRSDFQYYFYIGTVGRKGWHVFEVV